MELWLFFCGMGYLLYSMLQIHTRFDKLDEKLDEILKRQEKP